VNPLRVAVAYSAGRDSTALLHATLTAAQESGLEVVALHVHHGLSPHAHEWLAHAQRQCASWAAQGLPVQLRHHRVTARPATGDSIEAWARQVRYAALAELAREAGVDTVLLAHHRRDQAETWVLQALRGAGVDGQAGMPERVVRDGIHWIRPWLRWPREAIERYVEQHRLDHIDDDSNRDERLARNRLRLSVWPALAAAFPQAEASLADAARWASQASDALDELAVLDLAEVAPDGPLRLAGWRRLSEARRSNALRAWLRSNLGAPAPSSLVLRLLTELPAASASRWPTPGAHELRLYRGTLRCIETVEVHHAPTLAAEPIERALTIARSGRFDLPGWRGELVARRVREGGVPLAWLARLDLRERVGGERFQAGIGRPPRSLKKQYQAAGVPAWLREGPLLYSGGQLVFVPGLGLDARVLALPGQPQLALEWRPHEKTSPEAGIASARS
jgi:tRNA(Ile)-lysidine synthase